MHGAVSILVRGTVKSLKWRSVFTKATYSAHCSSSLCIKPCQTSSAQGSPGKTSMPMTFLSSLNHWRNMSGGCWLGKKQWRRIFRGDSKCKKDKDHDLWYRPGPPAELRQVSMCCVSHWSGQQQHLLQRMQALGAQEMQWAQAIDKGPWLQMHTLPGNCMPHGWQTREKPVLTSWRW